MKLSLLVLTAGKWEGKLIPLTTLPFLVGRDAQCHLRPASPLISKRHCALVVRDQQLMVRDEGSTNGTLLNGQPVAGEQPLADGDKLEIGPLLFQVKVEQSTPVDKPTPLPPTRPAKETNGADDEAADLLLAMQDDGPPAEATTEASPATAVMEAPPAQAPEPEVAAAAASEKPRLYKVKTAAKASGDTSTAAQEILKLYMRRDRK
jgi:pSer/pThr/pTyr-binding forkhead associated (FHA) protein